MMNKSRLFFYITLIFALDFFVWHKIFDQVFLGEGYYYFDRAQDFFVKLNNLKPLEQLDIFAKIIFDILPTFFGDNIRLYQLFLLLTISTLHAILFLTITKITKSALLGFTAAVFILANYTSSFGMTAAGQYQWFVQRVPGLIPTLISFYFLEKFFLQKRISYYFVSVGMYVAAVFLAHFSTFLLPVFIILPLMQFVGSKSKLKSILLATVLIIPFISIGYIFNKQDGQSPKINPIKFVFSADSIKIFQRTVFQVPIITLPPDLIRVAGQTWPNQGLPYPFTRVVAVSSYLLLGVLTGAIFLVRKKGDRLTKLYLTSYLGALSIMFLYVYVDKKLDVLKGIGQSRQFFPSAIFLSIAWAIIIHSIFNERKRLYFIVSLMILIPYVLYNSIIINKHIDSIQYSSEMMKRFIVYTKSISNQFTSESIMIAPSYLGWPNPMIKLFYAPIGFKFALPLPGWEEEYRDESENVFVFDYDYERNESRFDPEKGIVIDLTDKYRAGDKIKFLQ